MGIVTTFMAAEGVALGFWLPALFVAVALIVYALWLWFSSSPDDQTDAALMQGDRNSLEVLRSGGFDPVQ